MICVILHSEMLLPSSIERQSVCELEVDVMAADILNRREVTGQFSVLYLYVYLLLHFSSLV